MQHQITSGVLRLHRSDMPPLPSSPQVHRDEDVSIKVTQKPGFLCHIEATAAFRLPAGTLFKQVLTHPGRAADSYPAARLPPFPLQTPPADPLFAHVADNAAIFRHMDRCTLRRVLADDGHGRRTVKVAHEASWRFLFWRGTFTTQLEVHEDGALAGARGMVARPAPAFAPGRCPRDLLHDLGGRPALWVLHPQLCADNELTMDFELDPRGGGVMKRFHGRWAIRPHPADPQHASLSTLDQVAGAATLHPGGAASTTPREEGRVAWSAPVQIDLLR